MSGLLPILILLPLVGGIALLLLSRRGSEGSSGGFWAISVALIALAISVVLTGVVSQEATVAKLPAAEGVAYATIQPLVKYQPQWGSVEGPSGVSLQFALGLDGLGAMMALLTTSVVLMVLLFASRTVKQNFTSYAAWTLLAEAGLLTVFLSMDMILFYVGFELALVPLLVLISVWGSGDSQRAAKRFVVFTLAGSVPMVLALIGIVWHYPIGGVTTLFEELSRRAATNLPAETLASQSWIFGLLVLGLGIKMAILPLHTWLPTTYSASHPTTTALLAAVVLKLGLFGFMRIALPLVPVACLEYGPLLLGFAGAFAIVYGALAALAQGDLRLLLAYSSLSHVGFITLGMFALNEEGIAGASLQMVNHGITTAAMFLLVGCLIERRGSSNIAKAGGGLASLYPRLAVLLLFFVFAGAGMPGLNNFVGEVMALIAMMARHPTLTVISALGVLLGAWYSLRMAKDLLFGQLVKQKGDSDGATDLQTIEWAPLAALAIISLAIGCYPQPAIDLVKQDASRLAGIYSSLDGMAKANSTALVTPEASTPKLAIEEGR